MAVQLTPAQELGMIELTTREGASLLLVASTIWAIEDDPKESFTILKTASEPIGIMETPAIIVERMKELYEAREKAVIEAQQENLALHKMATAEREEERLKDFDVDLTAGVPDEPEDPTDAVAQEWYDREMGVDPNE
jgi:hypothetical protein